jgi:murein DD-endopeptidase MepM/ murein hydrolase activator NlpD
MYPLAYLAILAGALLLTSGLTASSIASTAQGKPDRARAGAGGEPSSSTTPGSSATFAAAHEFDGLIAAGERVLEVGRKDQGRDLRLEPGAPLLSTGHARVIRNGSDPLGFGPNYPILEMLSGPFAGHDVYYGHIDSAVRAGQVLNPGQVVGYTSRTGHNAPPGWVEFGYAPSGSPGPFGQPVPF